MKMVTVCSFYSAFEQLGPRFIYPPTAHLGLIYRFTFLTPVKLHIQVPIY